MLYHNHHSKKIVSNEKPLVIMGNKPLFLCKQNNLNLLYITHD